MSRTLGGRRIRDVQINYERLRAVGVYGRTLVEQVYGCLVGVKDH